MTTGSPRPVLVALGTADGHDAALRFACRHAMSVTAPLLLVHVVENEPAERDELLVHQAALRARELTRGAVRIETMTPHGPLVPTLVALSRGADGVVLERRPFSTLQRVILGSISTEVAGRSQATTITVPATWEASPEQDRRVVVGIDRAGDDLPVVAHAFARAAVLGAGLRIVHGWQMDSAYDDAIVGRADVAEWRGHYVGSLERAVRGLGSTSVPWSLQVVHAAPAEALLAACVDADTLVLGRGGADVPLVGGLGSVTRALLRDAACPVEVTGPADEQQPRVPAARTAPWT